MRPSKHNAPYGGRLSVSHKKEKPFALLPESTKSAKHLHKAITCYICKTPYTQLHFFYHSLCPKCAEINYQKRQNSTNLDGRIALVTGGRIKIGYQMVLRLLRDGARVILTTRFPSDCAYRYSREPDFDEWCNRLEIHGLDLRNILAVETFLQDLLYTESGLDIIHLGDRGVTVLTDGLAENKTLIDLGLASNGIGVEGCNSLLAALETHPAIGNLDLGYSPSTRVLGAQPNQIGDIGASAIAKFLKSNSTLSKLNLARNEISEEGKIALITGLEINQKLCDLTLDGKPDRRIELLLERNCRLNLGKELEKPRSVALIQSVYR